MFDTLLVADRGEIACRVFRAARALGLRTVAVYSDADADAPHVQAADHAVRLGPAPAVDSYLRADAVLAAAVATGAGANGTDITAHGGWRAYLGSQNGG